MLSKRSTARTGQCHFSVFFLAFMEYNCPVFKLFDRYALKEILPPFFLGIAAYTFIMLLNQILFTAEMFIARGVALNSVLKLFFYLLPSMLSFTLPMSVLLGILAGLSRMSTDSEITALKTLGISHARLLRPLLFFAFCGWLVTSFLTLYLTPRANNRWVQTFTYEVIQKVHLNIYPRTFNESIPGMIIYIQDVTKDNQWKNIFLHMTGKSQQPRIVLAREGKLLLNADEQKAFLSLMHGEVHSYNPAEPENYSVTLFESFYEEVDLKKLFDKTNVRKRVREKDISELVTRIRSLDENIKKFPPEQRALPEYRQKLKARTSHWVEVHKRFAIPLSCFIFAFLALPLGAYTRKGGRTSGFTLSIVLILIYYILFTAGEQLAVQGRLPAWVGIWGPNILFALLAVYLFLRSLRESSFFPPLPLLFPRLTGRKTPGSIKTKKKETARPRARLSLRFPNILDRYILKKFIFIFLLAFISMIMLFVIVTFFEQVDTVYKHDKPLSLFFEYISFSIPNFIYLILPIAILVATLLCLGLLTKFNEITAMKACGISIYRVVVPIIILSIAISFFSFCLQENILPYTNQKAERIWDKIRDVPARTYNAFDRRWVMSKNGKRIYHYNYFDPLISSFSPLSIYDIDSDSWSLKRRIFVSRGFLKDSFFSTTAGWIRDFEDGLPVGYKADKRFTIRTSEKINYFVRERKEPSQMSFSELKTHIAELKDRNFETRDFEVDLIYKTSFPLACLIMALIGIPFAFSMGKRGALVGLGLSLAIAMVYWGAIGIFKNLGLVEYLPPFLAAWGPNLIFGLAGLYLIFSLRT